MLIKLTGKRSDFYHPPFAPKQPSWPSPISVVFHRRSEASSYRYFFPGTTLGLGEQDGRKSLSNSTHDGGHCNSTSVSGGPALLVLNKQIRKECLPIFARSVDCLEVRNSSNFEIPPAFLASVKEVRLDSPHVQLFDKRECPNLQLLRIDLSTAVEGNFDVLSRAANKEEMGNSVVLKARARFWGTHVHQELGERLPEDLEMHPVKILLDLGSGNLLYRMWGRSCFLDNVVVDWQKQEVVSGGPLREAPVWTQKQ